jgi:hypothetical protein
MKILELKKTQNWKKKLSSGLDNTLDTAKEPGAGGSHL